MIAESQPSIASLQQKISVLTAGKQQWEADTSQALAHIQALQDYASVLRTTLSQVETAAALLHEEHENRNRLTALFDEPMDELREELTALRTEYERTLRVDIVPSSPQHRTISMRLPPMCVLFETYASVNGERMRLPPDVMEGIIPMVGRGTSGVFYREEACSAEIFRRRSAWISSRRYLNTTYSLPDRMSDDALASVLRQHNWFVIQYSESRRLSEFPIGSAHFYDDAGNEQSFLFFRYPYSSSKITIGMDEQFSPLVFPIVENVVRDIDRRSKRSRLE